MRTLHDQMRAGSATDWRSGQHTNPVRAARRQKVKALGGIRKFKRVMRAFWEQCNV